MRNFFITALLATACFSTSATLAAPLNVFLDDDAALHLSFSNLAETRAAIQGPLFADLATKPELSDFFESLQEAFSSEGGASFQQVMEEEFGLTVDDFFELFPGQISFTMFNLAELLLGQAERPEVVIMAEYAGDSDRLTELMQVQFERNAAQQKKANPLLEHVWVEEIFMGETLHLDETFDGETTYIEDGYALVDGIFILATPEKRLRSIVEAIKEGSASPLVNTDGYQRARELGGRGDFSLYLNLKAMMPPLNRALIDQSMESGGAMFGLSGTSLNQALGLESWKTLFFDLDLVDAGVRAQAGLLYREKTGLLRLLTYADTPLPRADYVPPSIYSTSVSTFDLGAMFTQLERILASASPTMPMWIDMQLQNVRTQTGVDLRRAILENLGGSVVSLAALPERRSGGQAILRPEQVYLVDVRDAEGLSGAVRALVDLIPGARDMIEEQRFAGQTIQTIRGRTDPNVIEIQANDVSYVITRSQLISNAGDASLLKKVLTRMESGEPGFWQLPSTDALFDSIAMEGAVARTYLDLEQMVMPMLQALGMGVRLSGQGDFLNLSTIPADLAFPFHMATEWNEAGDAMFGRMVIIKKEGAQ